MNAGCDWDVSTFMANESILTPRDKEIQSLFARGKSARDHCDPAWHHDFQGAAGDCDGGGLIEQLKEAA